jgi:hybrid cluster-associated redox disulfide protein
MDEPVIHPDDLIEPALERHSGLAAVFVRRGMACVGCDMARFDTVADAARAYRQRSDDLVAELDAAARKATTTDDPKGE